MSFDGHGLRVGLDVFSADNVYLGTVVRIRWAARPAGRSSGIPYGVQRSGRAPVDRRQPTELLIFRCLVSLNWATARPRLRRIPVGLIQLAALERVVLSVSAAELD